ncbi:MAG: thioesterase [Flavobacteriales bacterium]|nr:MAG: thioesterase [Flavobacteriales bacterium]
MKLTTKEKIAKFQKLALNPLLFKLYLLKDLPVGLLVGLRVRELNEERCKVTIPYKYLTKNPFRSIYFACLSMAAELSTGVMGVLAVRSAEVPVSMLVVCMEGDFTKKAVGRITFTCNDGQKIFDAVAQSIAMSEGVAVTATSIGIDEQGDKVAEFRFSWSFKPKGSPKGRS